MGKIIVVPDIGDSVLSAFFAVNLSAALASGCRNKVACVDLSFSGENNLGYLLSSDARKSLKDIAGNLAGLDENLIKGYLPVHSSNVAVLSGGDRDLKDVIAQDDIGKIVRVVSSAYPFTVVVAGGCWDAHFSPVLEASDLVMAAVEPNMISLSGIKGLTKVLAAGHFPLSVLKPVLLSSDSKLKLDRKRTEEFLSLEVFFDIPFDYALFTSSVNDGAPLVVSDGSSAPAQGFKKLARQLLDEKLYGEKKSVEGADRKTDNRIKAATDGVIRLKQKVHGQLLSELSSRKVDLSANSDPSRRQALREAVKKTIQDLLARDADGVAREERENFVEEMLDEALGLGCLEKLLKNDEITEIMVNGPDLIYVEKKGKVFLSGERFSSRAQLMTAIDRIVSPIGRRVDESSPLCDARLLDGSRVNIVISPISLIGPVVTIRKFSKKKLGIDDLVSFGAMKKQMAEFLRTCVMLRKNIVVSGGTGSGKTTLLNVVSSFIPSDERIVTIEDSAELKLPQEHVVRLESRPASIEGTGEVPIRRLVINALRMRPERIVVGECRGGETLDMLQAMNTGHDGSLTTIHANSPKDGVSRIATMVMMAGMDLPEKAIREQIASAVNVIVQLSRLSDGSRKVVEIAEVAGLKNGEVELVPIFRFEQTGIKDGKVSGRFVATGNLPSFFDGLSAHGMELDKRIFAKGDLQ
ncbi:MAG: Flp pilus assembly complex ATPase component TadA [Endomicrobiales bacterium]|nr:Flp pilus assembly complex ATPase component TadA [Endomicrobiales bacterium]